MLLGTQVKNCLIGGPAFGRLQKGDMIVKIDGHRVNEDNILPRLLGSDIPGSEVIITVHRRKEGDKDDIGSEYCGLHSNIAGVDELDIGLTRISTTEIADRRRMFDLFTVLEKHFYFEVHFLVVI
jgi:PDZ domain-containing secreted protein